MTSIPNATVEAYSKAWNEPNDAARLRLLEVAWADDGVLRGPLGEVTGRVALSGLIGDALRAVPGRTFERGRTLQGTGGAHAFEWTLRAPGLALTTGYASGEVDDAGRLTLLEMFVGGAAEEPDEGAWKKLRAWAFGNPLAVAGLLVLLVYVMLRLQAERFYDQFGATPEDAGFGPAELVIRQSARVLLTFVGIGLVWSVGYFVGMYPFVVTTSIRGLIGRTGRRWEPLLAFGVSMAAIALIGIGSTSLDWVVIAPGVALAIIALYLPRWLIRGAGEARAVARRRTLAWGRWVAVLGTLMFGFLTLASTGWIKAKDDADKVVRGDALKSEDFPWRARRVQAIWNAGSSRPALPACGKLVYLGEANGRVLLYDQANDQTLRLVSGDVQLTFPKSC